MAGYTHMNPLIPPEILDEFRTKKFSAIFTYIYLHEFGSITDADGNTLLHLAALHDCSQIIVYCIKTSKKSTSLMVNSKNKNGDTPLHLAIGNCRIRDMHRSDLWPQYGSEHYKNTCRALQKEYLERGELNVHYDHYDIFFLLWLLGADINAKDSRGNPPLHIAVALSGSSDSYDYNYEYKNHMRDEELSKIAIALRDVFGATEYQVDVKGRSFKDVVSEACKKGHFEGFFGHIIRDQMTKLIEALGKDKDNDVKLQKAIDFAKESDSLMRLANYLYHDLKDFKNSYDVYALVGKYPSDDYIEANKKMAEAIMHLLTAHAAGYCELSQEEIEDYKRNLFVHTLLSQEHEVAARLLQHELMGLSNLTLKVGTLDGTPESYLPIAACFRQEHQRAESLAKENSTLKEENQNLRRELNELRQSKETRNDSSSSEFWAKANDSPPRIEITLKDAIPENPPLPTLRKE